MTTEKQIKLKSGAVLPKGLPVSFLPNEPWVCLVDAGLDHPVRVRITSAFKAPSIEYLEEASNDGVCESVGGQTVEPDGYDQYGSPSWLLALGLI